MNDYITAEERVGALPLRYKNWMMMLVWIVCLLMMR